MTLHPAALGELERLGVATVRARLAGLPPNYQAPDQIVILGTGGFDPPRGDVEDWLREKDIAAEREAAQRHAEQVTLGRDTVWWAKWAALLAAATLVASVLLGLHPF